MGCPLEADDVEGASASADDGDVFAAHQRQLAHQVARQRHHEVSALRDHATDLHLNIDTIDNPRLVNFKRNAREIERRGPWESA
jgi:hypothetical protein